MVRSLISDRPSGILPCPGTCTLLNVHSAVGTT
jgi:hypothetical protein